MLSYLTPDYVLDSYRLVTPEFLCSIGCAFLFCDIDNTLAPYETPEPDDAIRAWLSSLANAGIRVVFVSNNHADRVELFNRTLSLPAYPDSKKPLAGKLRRIMKEVGAKRENTVFLGDQIFTDVMSARAVGARAALFVPPIKDKLTPFFRFKRALEKPILKRYHKLHSQKEDK